MLADTLNLVLDTQEPPDWARLGEHLPYEWIEQAIAQTGRASIRHRRLPAGGGMGGRYPQVGGVTLTAIPTHLVVDAVFGRYDTNEMLYAKTLVPDIPDHTLTVFDRGFLAAEILCGLPAHGHNRHFLIPAKSNTK